MASITRTKSGKWRAQVDILKFRSSATLPTLDAAKEWARNVEAMARGSTNSRPMQLTPREIVDLFRKSQDRAIARGISYSLTRDDLIELFKKSGGRCSVSGISFSRYRPPRSTKRPWFPSLDRINSALPYTKNNCRFVCVAVNIAMGEWGEWVVRSIAEAIAFSKPVDNPSAESFTYSFPAIADNADLTYRQIVRRRNRAQAKRADAIFTPTS